MQNNSYSSNNSSISGARKPLGTQVGELVTSIAEQGVSKVADKWRRKMTTAVYAVSWGAVVTEYYKAEAEGNAARASAVEKFLETVLEQELKELSGYTRETVLAYLRRGVVMSRFAVANMRQVYTDFTLQGLAPGASRGIWAGMPFIRPASMGRARARLELLVSTGAESKEVKTQAEKDYLLLSAKLEEFVGLCREFRPDYAGKTDDEVANEFDPDFLRCVQAAGKS